MAAGQRASVASTGLGCAQGPQRGRGDGKAQTHPVKCKLSTGCLPSSRETDGDFQMLHNCCFKKNDISVVVSQKVSVYCHQNLLMSKNHLSPLPFVPVMLLVWVFNPSCVRFFHLTSLGWLHWRVFITNPFAPPQVQQLLTSDQQREDKAGLRASPFSF